MINGYFFFMILFRTKEPPKKKQIDNPNPIKFIFESSFCFFNLLFLLLLSTNRGKNSSLIDWIKVKQ